MIFLLSSLLAIGASVFAFAVCTFWAINIARDEPNQRPPLWWVMIALTNAIQRSRIQTEV